MILDTSAIIAVLSDEPDAPDLAQRIEAAQAVRVSAATVLEASLVAGPRRQRDLDDLLAAAAANIVPSTTPNWRSRGKAICGSAGAAGHPPGSTTATASPMRWPVL